MTWLHYDYGSASVLEVLWTVVALAGFWYTFNCLTECRHDLDALAQLPDFRGDGPRQVIALANQRQYVVRLWAFIVYLVLGAFGLKTPPLHSNQPSLYALALGAGLISLEVLMTLASFFDTRDRRRVLAYIARQEALRAPGPSIAP